MRSFPPPTAWMAAILAAASLIASPAATQQGPGQFDVDEDAAERALERALVQTGSVLLPSGSAEIVPFVAYTRSEQEVAGLPALVNGQLTGSSIERERDELQTGLGIRAGLPWAGQIDLTIPFVTVDETVNQRVLGVPFSHAASDLSGIGDVKLAYTHSLTGDDPSRPNVLATVAWDSDTGKTENGLSTGSGFNELELALGTTVRQDPLVFLGRFSYLKSFEKDGVQMDDTLSLSANAFLSVNPETSFQFGLSVSHAGDIEIDGVEIEGTDRLAATLDLGLATIIRRNTLLDTKLSVGLTEDAPEFGLSVNMPLRISF